MAPEMLLCKQPLTDPALDKGMTKHFPYRDQQKNDIVINHGP